MIRFLTLLASFCLHAIAQVAEDQATIGVWNLNRGDYDRILSEIGDARLDEADFLVLQETIGRKPGNLAQRLAEELGYYNVQHSFNAILSKTPPVARGALLVNSQRERHLPWADYRLGEGMVRIYCVHLTFRTRFSPLIPQTRAQEVRRLLEHAESFAGPIVIAGDFNSLGNLSGNEEEAQILLKRRGFIDALVDQPGATHDIFGRLDWIFVRGLPVESATRGNYAGSDHRWLRVRLGPSTPATQ